MDRWIWDSGHGPWAFVDADGTGRVFDGYGSAHDVNEKEQSALFKKVRRLGKKCTAPGDAELVVQLRRKLTL